MCQAVQEMCDDARAEGRTQGFTEGESIGLNEFGCLGTVKLKCYRLFHFFSTKNSCDVTLTS